MDIKNALADPFAFLRRQAGTMQQQRADAAREADQPPAGRVEPPELLETRQERTAAARTVWHQVAEKYDVTRLNEVERRDIARRLYEAGAITMMDRAQLSLSATPAGWTAASGSSLLTQPDSQGRYDLLSETRARLDRFGEADPEYGHGQKRVLEILNRIQAARNGPLSVSI